MIPEISLCDISYIIKKCTCVIAPASPHEKTVDVKINGFCGAHFRNRTRDTGIFSPLLYLLSYLGIHLFIKMWWAFRDLNPGPAGYEPDALTN